MLVRLAWGLGKFTVKNILIPIAKKWIDEGEWTVEIGARFYPATASLKPLFDPTNSKIKG